MDRANIDKIAQNSDDKLLLAKLWDKINAGIRKDIPVSTCFLSPRELQMAQYLFGDVPGLHRFGGYAEAERQMLVYLPEYMPEDSLMSEASPVVSLRATWFAGDTVSHRDLLGALMGAGIGRETVGDICVGTGSCDFFVTEEIAPYILQNFTGAGRVKLHVEQIALSQVQLPTPQVQSIRDTVASLRLDSILSAGFRISRNTAAQAVAAGRAAINGLPCEKSDKAVAEGDKISLRGMGKILLRSVNGQTKKGRISVVIDRYV